MLICIAMPGGMATGYVACASASMKLHPIRRPGAQRLLFDTTIEDPR